LISRPSTPQRTDRRFDPQMLTERLEKLNQTQDLRIKIYGEGFAMQWPISRTPRDLAEEAKIRVLKGWDELLCLDEDSTSEEEFDRVMARFTKTRQPRKSKPKLAVENPVQLRSP
ncbi:hypothetical protein EDB81DRAFT_625099, partial [Dactylonectria macrodidyma]